MSSQQAVTANQSTSNVVSILDIDPKNPPEKGYQNIINSPRTLEAC